jgi:hypothetical protein
VPHRNPTAPAASLAGIINDLFRAISWRRDVGLLAAPVALLLCARLGVLRGRLIRLAARIAAGRGPGVPRAPRRPRDPASRPAPRRSPQCLLPRGSGWLVRLMPEAAVGCSRLQHLFADPEMAEFAAAAPQLGRLLRPLCRSVNLTLPPYLRPPPQPPRPRRARGAAKPRVSRPARAASFRPSLRVAWPTLHRPPGLAWLLKAPARSPPPGTNPPIPLSPPEPA